MVEAVDELLEAAVSQGLLEQHLRSNEVPDRDVALPRTAAAAAIPAIPSTTTMAVTTARPSS